VIFLSAEGLKKRGIRNEEFIVIFSLSSSFEIKKERERRGLIEVQLK
jgi:hypothetical protein